MRLEVRLPISATPSFLTRVRLIAASVRRFYPDAIVRAYIGDPGGKTPDKERMVEEAFGGRKIGFEWVSQSAFDAWKGTKNEYIATMMARWAPPFSGTHILMLDADVLVTGRIDEWVGAKGLCGVQAHVPPFPNYMWDMLALRGGLDDLGPSHDYSGWNVMYFDGPRSGPAYMNTGVVFGSAELYAQMHEPYAFALNDLRRVMDTYFFEQVALTLAALRIGSPLQIHSLRYNFPNQRVFDIARPAEMADVRLLHFLRTDVINRDVDFSGPAALRLLCARGDLEGSNEVLRQHVAALMGEFDGA